MRCDGLMAEVQNWAAGLEEVHARIAGRFVRAEPRARVLAHLRGLIGQPERKNGWTLAEAADELLRMGCSGLLRTADWNADRSVTCCVPARWSGSARAGVDPWRRQVARGARDGPVRKLRASYRRALRSAEVFVIVTVRSGEAAGAGSISGRNQVRETAGHGSPVLPVIGAAGPSYSRPGGQ